MGISLSKGGNISLSKEAGSAGVAKLTVGLGWDPRATDGVDFDLDASAFLLNAGGKVRSDADFIFYNQRNSACGGIEHMGDNRTGGGDGDEIRFWIFFVTGGGRDDEKSKCYSDQM